MNIPALTPENWLDLALSELRDHGYGALKAQPLAKKLGVTRGSFYYHFDSLETFHKAVIEHWSERTSRGLIEAAMAATDPRAALDDLLQTTLRSGEDMERAIRSWSTVHPLVAEAVEKVDQDRIEASETLLTRCGVPHSDAAPRAKLLYWAAIGRLMLPFPNRNHLSDVEISRIAEVISR